MFSSPEPPGLLIINRVIGLPGETFEIRDKRVFIGGKPLAEAYAVFRDHKRTAQEYLDERLARRDKLRPLSIPAGHYFVMGDNRDNSYDSRFYGPVPRENFHYGGPLILYWSPDRRRIGKVLR